MKKTLAHGLTLVVLTTVAGLQPVAAAPVNAVAGVSTISPCPSFCGGAGAASDGNSQGGAGETFAHAVLNNVDGQGEAQADLSGTLGTPVLRAWAGSHAESSSTRSSSAGASAVGMRQFVYSGPDTTIDLLVDLHGRAVASNPNDALLQARALVFSGPDLDIFSTSFGTFKFETIPSHPELTLLGDTTVFVPTTAGLATVEGSVTFDLHNGESFFVWAQISASGTRGGMADGYGTLNLSFSDPTGITPVGPAPVPVPATLWLLGSALGGLAAQRRRAY